MLLPPAFRLINPGAQTPIVPPPTPKVLSRWIIAPVHAEPSRAGPGRGVPLIHLLAESPGVVANRAAPQPPPLGGYEDIRRYTTLSRRLPLEEVLPLVLPFVLRSAPNTEKRKRSAKKRRRWIYEITAESA